MADIVRLEPRSRLPLGLSPRVPLGYQVLVGIGGLVVLVALAVGLAVVLVRGLGDGAADLTAREVEYARSIDAAALRAKAMANDERGFLLSGRDSFMQRFERRAVLVRASFAAAERAAAEREQRAAVRETSVGFTRWLEAVRAEVATYKAGNRDAAIASALGETRDLRYAYEELLRDAQQLGASAIASSAHSVSAASSQSIAILLIYLAVALVVGVAVGIWLVRTILKPVYALLAIFAEPGSTERRVARYSRAAR